MQDHQTTMLSKLQQRQQHSRWMKAFVPAAKAVDHEPESDVIQLTQQNLQNPPVDPVGIWLGNAAQHLYAV